jgi:hypothetical protein
MAIGKSGSSTAGALSSTASRFLATYAAIKRPTTPNMINVKRAGVRRLTERSFAVNA